MKEFKESTLIKEAYDKGFKSKDTLTAVYIDYWYIWMCELEQWLRDKHNTHIMISVASAGDGEEEIKWYYSYICGINDCLSDEAFSCMCDESFTSYELALEEALKVTLDCIYNEKISK